MTIERNKPGRVQEHNPANRTTAHEPAKAPVAKPAAQGKEASADDAARAQAFSGKYNVGGFKQPLIARSSTPTPSETSAEQHFDADSLGAMGGSIEAFNDIVASGSSSVSTVSVDGEEMTMDPLDHTAGVMNLFTAFKKAGLA